MKRLFASLVLAVVAVGGTTACGAPDDEATDESTADLVGRETHCGELSSVPGMDVERVDADGGKVHLRIGTMTPTGPIKGDVLFLHGFSDRFDNHLPLFEQWRSAGFRVVAFDYPSHGETCGYGLERYRMGGLAHLASFVEQHTRPADARPLVVAGWSTGGLLTVRMLQVPSLALGRRVDGAFLLAPGIDVKLFVGDHQMVTEETLTHDPNPPHRGAISPRSPLQTPLFSADLIYNAQRAREDAYPGNVPTFVVTGGQDDDVYANTKGVVAWVEARQREGAVVSGASCAGGRHELDNEAAPMRDDVRHSGVTFASWVAAGARGQMPSTPEEACVRY